MSRKLRQSTAQCFDAIPRIEIVAHQPNNPDLNVLHGLSSSQAGSFFIDKKRAKSNMYRTWDSAEQYNLISECEIHELLMKSSMPWKKHSTSATLERTESNIPILLLNFLLKFGLRETSKSRKESGYKTLA